MCWKEACSKSVTVCASWPKEYGGRGLSAVEQVVLNEEFARAKAPMRVSSLGEILVGPTLLQWGTEEQKQRFLVPQAKEARAVPARTCDHPRDLGEAVISLAVVGKAVLQHGYAVALVFPLPDKHGSRFDPTR